MTKHKARRMGSVRRNAYRRSQTSAALWRKNRDTADSGGDPSKVGIDINRNQDFLWDFNTDFAAGAINDYLASTDPSVDTKAFTSSLGEVRGTLYVAKPGFSLYPTSGTNDDYAYSRHFIDPSKAKSLSFTVEWGTEFQPPWTEMENIIQDVSAGLIALGLEALGIDSYIVANRDTFSSYEVATVLSYPSERTP